MARRSFSDLVAAEGVDAGEPDAAPVIPSSRPGEPAPMRPADPAPAQAGERPPGPAGERTARRPAARAPGRTRARASAREGTRAAAGTPAPPPASPTGLAAGQWRRVVEVEARRWAAAAERLAERDDALGGAIQAATAAGVPPAEVALWLDANGAAASPARPG
jgi:hypothetical protein